MMLTEQQQGSYRAKPEDEDREGEFLERVDGIEPTYAAWKAAVLPLNYTR